MQDEELRTALGQLHQIMSGTEYVDLVWQAIQLMTRLPAAEHWLPLKFVNTFLSHTADKVFEIGDRHRSRMHRRRGPSSGAIEELKEYIRSEKVKQFVKPDSLQLFEHLPEGSRWVTLAKYLLHKAGLSEEEVYTPPKETSRFRTEKNKFSIKQQKEVGLFDINLSYLYTERENSPRINQNDIFESSAMVLLKPEYWNHLAETRKVSSFDCGWLYDEEILDIVFSADFPSIPDLRTRLGITRDVLQCHLVHLSAHYHRRAAEAQKKTKEDAVGLLPLCPITSMIPAAESILRTVSHAYSMHSIQEDSKFWDLRFFMLKIRYLLVHWCENKTAEEMAKFDWLRDTIFAFLLLSQVVYLPDSVLGKVKELTTGHNGWKAVMQLYQHMFMLQSPEFLTEQLDSLFEWYAQDIQDEAHIAAYDFIIFLYYGDTNEGLAEVRKTDALTFLSKHPRLVPVAYRFVKNSGLMEERFWSLFDDNKKKMQVVEEEKALPMSKKDAAFGSSGAVFLPPLLESLWSSIPSGSSVKEDLSRAMKLQVIWDSLLAAATTCSNPSASKDQCTSAIVDAKSSVPRNIDDTNLLMGAIIGMPSFKNWMEKFIVQPVVASIFPSEY
jgi:hypothetical protein